MAQRGTKSARAQGRRAGQEAVEGGGGGGDRAAAWGSSTTCSALLERLMSAHRHYRAIRVSRTGPQSSAQKLLPGPNHGFMVENFTGSATTDCKLLR